MEHPSLRHRRFSYLPNEIQLDIIHRIESRLSIQKIRSAAPEFRLILPNQPPHQHLDMVIPFFNNNGDILSEGAVLRTYEVYNCRDGRWVVQLDYNLQDEDGQSLGLMHPLTEADFDPGFVPPRIFDPVHYDSIELPSRYRLTAVTGGVFRDIAFRPESIWTVLEDFMILMILREDRLALYKSVDQSWGLIEHDCVDVICYDRKLYALENTGRTFMVHADRTTEEVVNPIVGENGHNKCLVESGGDLLLVDRYYHNPNEEDVNHRRTSRFVVFRFVEEEHTWVRIHTLGGRVLFVGYFSRFSAAAADVAGARGDLIYFSEAFAIDVDVDVDVAEDEDGNDDGNEDDKKDIHGPGPGPGPGSKDEGEDEDEEGGENGNEDEGEVGNEDEDGGDIHGPGREDVGIFDMVDGIITNLGNPGAAQFAACFWPPPAWTADAAV